MVFSEELQNISRKAAKRWADENFVLNYMSNKEYRNKDEDFYRKTFLKDLSKIREPEDILSDGDLLDLTEYLAKIGIDPQKDAIAYTNYAVKVAADAADTALEFLMSTAKKDLIDKWNSNAVLSTKRAKRYQQTFKSRKNAN